MGEWLSIGAGLLLVYAWSAWALHRLGFSAYDPGEAPRHRLDARQDAAGGAPALLPRPSAARCGGSAGATTVAPSVTDTARDIP